MVNQEKVKAAIDRLVENNGQPRVFVRGPSQELEEAVRNPSNRDLIPFVHLHPVKVFYGLAKLAGDLDEMEMDIIARQSVYIAGSVYDWHPSATFNTEGRKGLGSILFRFYQRFARRNYQGGLNRFYDWLEDTQSKHSSLKNYFAALSLRCFEVDGISIDPYVSEQLKRLPATSS